MSLYPTSSFWTPVGASPRIDPNSGPITAAFLAQGPWGSKPLGSELTKADWSRPFYRAKATDPTVTVRQGLGGSWKQPEPEGDLIHYPANAKPAAGQYWEANDGGCSFLQPNGLIYSFWRLAYPISGACYEAAVIDSRLDGRPNGGYAGMGQAHLGVRQGTVTYKELVLDGHIPHALFAEVRNWCGRRWPGWYPDDGKRRGGQVYGTNDPPMGGRAYLDYSPTEIAALNLKPWQKVLVTCLAEYGFVTYDNGSSAHSLDWESGIPWLVRGQPNHWVDWAKSQGIPGHFDQVAQTTLYSVDIEHLGVDWRRLRWLAV